MDTTSTENTQTMKTPVINTYTVNFSAYVYIQGWKNLTSPIEARVSEWENYMETFRIFTSAATAFNCYDERMSIFFQP